MVSVLPPAPNWFSAQILRCSCQGRMAYGARNAVVFLRCEPRSHYVLPQDRHEDEKSEGADSTNWRQSPRRSPTSASPDLLPPEVNIVTTAFGAKSKVSSVCWSPDGSQLVAASDEGNVRLMKVDDADRGLDVTCTHSHAMHKELGRDRHKVNSVSWSRPDPAIVVSGDETGNMVVWDVKANSTRGVNVGKHNIFVLETHPRQADLVGFGCRLGLVFVVNINGSGKILHKIRGHDEDIQGLSWCPPNDGGDGDDDSLLAVSSRDRTMTIWNVKTGDSVSRLRLPGNGSGSGSGKQQKPQDQKMSWTTLFWFRPDVLLSSGLHGELLEWRRPFEANPPRVVHREHARTLYCIHTTGASVQSSGQDRSIVSYDLSANALDFHLPGFAAWVYSMAANAVDPSVIAVGAGDAQIRVWKTASRSKMFDVNVVWQKLNSAKVTALAWHPDKDNVLAFGTDEGRVGLIDAFSNRCVPTFCDFKHRNTVYTVCFGPAVGAHGEAASGGDAYSSVKKHLYSCGDGRVVMHTGGGGGFLDADDVVAATNALSRKRPSRSDVAFQTHEYRFAVLGCDDGLVEVLSVPRLELLATVKSFQKLVQCLAWHPFHVGAEASPNRWMLAVASNETEVHVWDLAPHLREPEKKAGDAAPPILTEPTVVLSGHHERVVYLAWSPHHVDARLLSVSYDCTAQVWDVGSGSPVANFSRHTDRLFCGMWSPVDPDVVFTGGEDCTVFGWRVSEQEDVLPKKVNRKAVVAAAKKAAASRNDHQVNDALSMLEAKRRELMMTTAAATKPAAAPKKKQRFFPASLAGENAARATAWDDCQRLAEGTPDDDALHLGFFAADGFRMDALLHEERRRLSEDGDHSAAAHVGVWAGDAGEVVRAAVRASKLDDWTVSMAAGAGYALWKESCVAYAAQLLREDGGVDAAAKAASYYLAAHRVRDAVDALRSHHLYRAAVAVARSRLPDDVPLLQELYTAWAFQSSSDGSYELAAKCWIAAGELSQAASLLAKRPDPSSLRVASILALKAGEYDRCRTLAAQCATVCAKNSDWGCLERLAAEVKFAEVCEAWEDAKKRMGEGEK